jgi:hypothetical protein
MSSSTTEKNKHLSIAHNIFLTRDQRYHLTQVGTQVEVVGVSVPCFVKAKKTLETSEEIFVKYLLKCVELADTRFIFHHNYYEIQLAPNMAKKLLDIKDDGIECLIFANHSGLRKDDEIIHCIHYISIQDEKILLESIMS